MQNSRKVIKLCRILTEVSIALLIIITVFLPFGISWYVETMHRSQTLPATVMVTCYPCAPFVGIALFMLRRILIRAYDGVFFTGANSKGYKGNISLLRRYSGYNTYCGAVLPAVLYSGLYLCLFGAAHLFGKRHFGGGKRKVE